MDVTNSLLFNFSTLKTAALPCAANPPNLGVRGEQLTEDIGHNVVVPAVGVLNFTPSSFC
jgi:hypothetical protein